MSTDHDPGARRPIADDLPRHARERIAEMRERKLFTSDLSVNEFLLVKQAGFDPLGLVMGSSIYQVAPVVPRVAPGQPGAEVVDMTRALYHARELAMARMEEEADELGADGVIGVRLTVNLNTDPTRQAWEQFRVWQRWARGVGYSRAQTQFTAAWRPDWPQYAWNQWLAWLQQQGTGFKPPPWAQPTSKASYQLGANVAEFIAVGTAVRHRGGESFKNKQGRPFQSALSGQEFWTLLRAGYRPVGFVMGNCVYYVPPELLRAPDAQSCELAPYTHALYDARELAIERLQAEAEALDATGVVDVTVSEQQHSWRGAPWNVGNAALQSGELLELFVLGTAVVPMATREPAPRAAMVLLANDAPPAPEGGER